MRAWEFIAESNDRAPHFTLRGLNKIKRDEKQRAASRTRKAKFVHLMYGDRKWALDRIELEKTQLELDQQKVELAAAKAELQIKDQEAVTKSAIKAVSTKRDDRKKVTDMAHTAMGRRKKRV